METSRTTIVVERTDGTTCGYDFADEDSASTWYDEVRDEWNAGRSVIFHVRPSTMLDSRCAPMHRGDDVAHLELTTPQDAVSRGIECRSAVTYG